MARTTTDSQLTKIQKQIAELQKKQQDLLSKTNSKVLAQIVTMAKKAGITAEEIVGALKASKPKTNSAKPRRKSHTAGTKVAPKYRNPANPEQTWTGRGKTPLWVQELQKHDALQSALINPAQ